MLPHPLTYFEIQKYYENEPKFNGAYSRNNLSKIKDGVYIINLELLSMLMIKMSPILIALELNIFQKKLKNPQKIKVL